MAKMIKNEEKFVLKLDINPKSKRLLMRNKYNIEEIREKLERCRNIPLS